MAKHRAEGPINDVMVTDMYIGDEAIGKIIMTDGEKAVLVFDEKTVGRSVKKLLEPDSLLAIRTTDEIRVGDRRDFEIPIQELPSEIDLDEYHPYFKKPGVFFNPNRGQLVTVLNSSNNPTLF